MASEFDARNPLYSPWMNTPYEDEEPSLFPDRDHVESGKDFSGFAMQRGGTRFVFDGDTFIWFRKGIPTLLEGSFDSFQEGELPPKEANSFIEEVERYFKDRPEYENVAPLIQSARDRLMHTTEQP